MATKLIFIRHGESEGNRQNVFNGHSDFELTELGMKQAERTAQYLDTYKIDAIYSSDLKRAFQTASAVAKRKNLEIIKDSNLREIYGGKFESVLYQSLQDIYPEEFYLWKNDMGNSRCPGGESVRELLERVNNAVLKIAESNHGKTVLIATHATPIRVMSTVWKKIDLTEIGTIDWVKNVSVTIVNYDDLKHPVVELYDEHEHLKDILTELPKSI